MSTTRTRKSAYFTLPYQATVNALSVNIGGFTFISGQWYAAYDPVDHKSKTEGSIIFRFSGISVCTPPQVTCGKPELAKGRCAKICIEPSAAIVGNTVLASTRILCTLGGTRFKKASPAQILKAEALIAAKAL